MTKADKALVKAIIDEAIAYERARCLREMVGVCLDTNGFTSAEDLAGMLRVVFSK